MADLEPLSHPGVTLEDLPAEVRADYELMRVLPDGRIIGVRRLMFHYTMAVDMDATGMADRNCFAEQWQAHLACLTWAGTGDPEHGHRHMGRGRRRDLATGREWVAW